MLEFLVAWGVANVSGFVFKAILEALAKSGAETLEGYVKDFFGVCIKDQIDLAKNISFKNAFGKAVKEFLSLVQQDLEDNIDQVDEILEYQDNLEIFIRKPDILKQLGIPFQKALGKTLDDLEIINTQLLIETWNDLNLKPLPQDFNWQKVIERYTKKVDYILQDSDELRKLLDSQNVSRLRQAAEENQPFSPDFDFRRYQKGLQQAYSKLNLDSLDTDGYKYRLDLWNIFVPQTLNEEETTTPNNISVSNIFNETQNYQYTVILGNPGSGKSTLAQYKALEWARINSSNLEIQELPLLIELRKYIKNLPSRKGFLEYFAHGSGVKGGNLNQRELHKWLSNYRSIVIFDGLDEVLDRAEREKIAIDITTFTNTYPKARVLVTSRVIGYKQQRHIFTSANFRHFMLQDLDMNQINSFVSQWHKLAFDDQDEGNRKRDRLLDSIRTIRTFRELAGNPLLLTMMAILNRNEKLPRDRITLYENASKLLVQKWDEEAKLLSSQITLEYRDKQEILEHIAFKIQTSPNFNGNILIIDEKTLDSIITDCLDSKRIVNAYLTAQELRRQLTNRSFILCFFGGDTYGFVHRTFLEYFCALYFIREYESERNISIDQLKEQVVIRQWLNDAWREVIILIIGKLSAKFAAELIDCLIDQNGQEHQFENLILASECLRQVRQRNNDRCQMTDNKLLDALKKLIENQPDITEETRNRLIAAIKATWENDSDTLQWLADLAP